MIRCSTSTTKMTHILVVFHSCDHLALSCGTQHAIKNVVVAGSMSSFTSGSLRVNRINNTPLLTFDHGLIGNNKYVSYSQFSMSTDQQPPKPEPVIEKRSKGGMILRLLALLLVGKMSYDTVQSVKAYRKGSKPLEIFLSEAWNDALYPLFTMVKESPEVVRELGYPVNIGAPPTGSTSPITELSRECMIGVNFPKPSKDVGTWFLKPVPQLSQSGGQQSSSSQQQQQQRPYSTSAGKPLVVPQPNSFPSFPYCEVTSEVVLPLIGGKPGSGNEKVGVLHAFIYTNESDWNVLSAKVIYPNGKSTIVVEPDIKGYQHPNQFGQQQ
ncbi:hypothetical protein DFA_02937 [Cavenderia fasciculata]|uniref:Uncharacterized protein n=1 Tax=Cavenderia fasciculata TaxID=261658 RepID=F4PG59_CACFS|nr:uncharacterized protein DFA_02937 [Cavenderia fasciculata]EGG24693.1 hypothetical protein DFA_02937 [Cavenderia fasciculata]|eukprot:XP_004362544.1 hypothetical protein DFA_02937 [Cavenderia fasciculata]